MANKLKYPSNDEPEEPPPKLARLRTRSIPFERTPRMRKCKNYPQNTSLTICDLPTEILEKIFGHINIWHHNRIRGTSRRMKEVNDVFVMHEFQKALKTSVSEDPKSVKSAALRIIKEATEVYVRSGFESTFCGCILPMLRCSYRDPFSPSITQIKQFLVHFYGMVTELLGDTALQRWRLLYIITLMRLVKAFKKSTITSTEGIPCRIVVELKGPWLGVLWTLKGRRLNQSRYRHNLLVILSEMLMANITGRGFKHVWECPSEMYVFGNDTGNGNHVPVTIFTFTICGSKMISNLFRSCLENGAEQFVWPSKWPKDQFTVNLDIICKAAMKWGCSKSQHMEFGPFDDMVYGDDDNQDNEADGNTVSYEEL